MAIHGTHKRNRNNVKWINAPTDKYLGLTEDEFKQFSTACHRTWNYIGCDIFQVEGVGDSIPRRDVVELVIDAGRLREHGSGVFRDSADTKAWQQLYDKRIRPWLDANYLTTNSKGKIVVNGKFARLMKEVFIYERYCN
jgi:hypothetical protein